MNNFLTSILKEPSFIIAIICLIGLIMQRKPIYKVLSGTILTVMGYTIISFGSRMVIESVFVLIKMFQNAFQLFGILPNNESMLAMLQIDFKYETTIVMIAGMLFNIVFARITKFKCIFLNGYYVLYMSSLIASIFAMKFGSGLPILVIAGLLLGFVMSLLPYMTLKYIKGITGHSNIAIGSFGIVGCMVSGAVSGLLFSKSKRTSCSDTLIKRTHPVKIFSDTNIIITLSMMAVFMITSLFADKGVISDMSNDTNFIVFSLKYSIMFSAGFYVIITGVRMFTEQLQYSFKGISEKLVPNAKPAIDPSILFPYNPSLVLIGFFSSLTGGMLSTLLQASLRIYTVIPSVMVHFFSGATSAFFGNLKGGRKGAVIGSFVQGILISFLPILSIAIYSELNITRTSFADSDFNIIGYIINYIFKLSEVILP